MPAVGDVRQRRPRTAQEIETWPVVADREDESLVQPCRTPVLPAQVSAEDRRQAFAVELESRGLAVVGGEDRAVLALAWGQLRPRSLNLSGHLRPTDLV